MDTHTRTEYTIKNAATAMAARIISILFGYAARIILTRTLCVDLVGINGLLSNVLGALTLPEMGIDVALVYTLYAPVAAGDTFKEYSLLRLYRKIYLIIAGLVALIGTGLYPLLLLLMQSQTYHADHFFLIYLLFVLNTSLTYICASRSLIFLADQRNYLNDYFYSLFLVIQYVLQIILLLITGNYLLFLVAQAACSILKNAASSFYAARRYPWIRSAICPSVPKNERKRIGQNTRAMLIHKIGNVIISNTDNLCLTFFSGLASVAKYANYYLIIGSIRQVADSIVRGIAGSVGNLATEKDTDNVRNVYQLTLFTVNWIYGFCSISLFCILSVFVGLSFGKHYAFSTAITFVLCLNFYLNGIRQATLVFRDSLGLFWFDRYKTIAESVINLIASILLAQRIGTIGVFIGTTISILSVSMWIEPLILYRRYFHKPLSSYMKRLAIYLPITALCLFSTCLCCYLADIALHLQSLWGQLLIRSLTCLVIPNLLYFLSFHKAKEYHQLLCSVTDYLNRLRRH